MEPTRALTTKPVPLSATTIPADTIVWVTGRFGNDIEIEFGKLRGRIPADSITPYPVESPGLDTLRLLDPCFGLGAEAFITEYTDQKRYFEIVRCKEHGKRFLRDTRGGIAMYQTLTLLNDKDGTPDEIWAKYHFISDSLLRFQGRTL